MSTPVFLASVCTTVKIKGRQLAAAGKMSAVVDAVMTPRQLAVVGEMSTVVDAVTTPRQLAAAGKMSTVVDAGDDALEAGRSWGNVYCSRCR